MKPWEETWEAEHEDSLDYITRGPDGFIAGFDDQKERATLAAAAPEMARVLLALEWKGAELGDDCTYAVCPSCGAYKGEVGHAPDCGLVAVLRKAGVVP